MAQKNKQGMRLRQKENPRNKNMDWLLQTVVSLVSGLVLVLFFGRLTGFDGNAAMAISSVCLCVIFGLLQRWERPHWFFYGVLVLLLVLVLICRNQVLEGYRLFWNQLSDARLQGTGWLLPEWELQLPKEKAGMALTLFAIVLSSVVSIVICALTAWAPGVLAVLLPLAALMGMVSLGTELPFAWMLLILAISVLILMYSGWGRKNAIAPIAVSWIVGAMLAAIVLLVVLLPEMKLWTKQVGVQLQENIHRQKYETEHTTLPEGDFRDYEESVNGVQPALIVTMENPESIYLRGFTGCVLEGNQWKPLETEILVKNKDLLYWLNLNAFNPNAQFYGASAQLGLDLGRVTIQNTGACSLYHYVPFSMYEGEALIPENLNTEGFLSDGERIYSYAAVSGGMDGISQVLQYLQESEDPAVLKYRKAESGYRHFVNNFYLQVPEEAKQLLSEKWDSIAAYYGNAYSLTLEQAQECTLRFLAEVFPENGIPENLTMPLDSAKGTTYQYATVAVLTLRYFGIPARYAEGYLITQQMAASVAPGAPLAVDSSCARAWPEVYQDGIGWIPMSMTPGIGEMIKEEPNDSSDEGDGDTENPELDPEEVEDDSPMEEDTEVPDPDGGGVIQVITTILTGFVKAMLLLIVIFLLLYFRRRNILKKKEMKFQDENRKDAVAWIFADSITILETLGFQWGNGSLRQLSDPVMDRFDYVYARQLEEMISLNERAMFSSRPMEEAERETALTFRDLTIQNVNTQTKWYRRLWLKWIRCLY